MAPRGQAGTGHARHQGPSLPVVGLAPRLARSMLVPNTASAPHGCPVPRRLCRGESSRLLRGASRAGTQWMRSYQPPSVPRYPPESVSSTFLLGGDRYVPDRGLPPAAVHALRASRVRRAEGGDGRRRALQPVPTRLDQEEGSSWRQRTRVHPRIQPLRGRSWAGVDLGRPPGSRTGSGGPGGQRGRGLRPRPLRRSPASTDPSARLPSGEGSGLRTAGRIRLGFMTRSWGGSFAPPPPRRASPPSRARVITLMMFEKTSRRWSHSTNGWLPTTWNASAVNVGPTRTRPGSTSRRIRSRARNGPEGTPMTSTGDLWQTCWRGDIDERGVVRGQ